MTLAGISSQSPRSIVLLVFSSALRKCFLFYSSAIIVIMIVTQLYLDSFAAVYLRWEKETTQ